MSISLTSSVHGLIIFNPGLMSLLNLPNSSMMPAILSHKIYQWRLATRTHSNIYSSTGQKDKHSRCTNHHNKCYSPPQRIFIDLCFAGIGVDIGMVSTCLVLQTMARKLAFIRVRHCLTFRCAGTHSQLRFRILQP